MEDIKQFGFEFLEANLTINNCLDILKLSVLYHYPPSSTTTHSFITQNFVEIAQTDAFKNISNEALTPLIAKLETTQVQQPSIFNAILSWTRQVEDRKRNFPALFLHLNLKKFSLQFLEEVVAKEPMVLQSVECMKAVMSGVFAKLKVDDFQSSKILCVNGHSKSVFEVYSIEKNTKIYPPVPNTPNRH